jgi:hypothetical protein
VAVTAAVLPLILGVAACGAEKADTTAAGSTGSTPTPVSTPTAPPKAPPAVSHLTTASFVPAMKKAVGSKTTLRTTMRMVANGQVMTVTGVQSTKPLAMQLEMNGAAFGGKAKMILVGGNLYVSMPGLAPSGKYVKVDPTDSSDPQAAAFGAMLKESDPTRTFDAFDGSLRSVKFVRSETVDGAKLDRYAVTVDTAKAMKAQGQKPVAGMPKTLAYSIWMDSSHLMRKMTFELPGVTMTMTASDWGKPVSIKAPPASSIVKR